MALVMLATSSALAVGGPQARGLQKAVANRRHTQRAEVNDAKGSKIGKGCTKRRCQVQQDHAHRLLLIRSASKLQSLLGFLALRQAIQLPPWAWVKGGWC